MGGGGGKWYVKNVSMYAALFRPYSGIVTQTVRRRARRRRRRESVPNRRRQRQTIRYRGLVPTPPSPCASTGLSKHGTRLTFLFLVFSDRGPCGFF